MAFIYWFMPRETETTINRAVAEKPTRQLDMPIRIGDQTGTITIPVDYEVAKLVSETVVKSPTREDNLRFVGLCAVAGLVYFYFAIVIVGFGRCMWSGKPATRALEIQFTAAITTSVGIFVGAVAVSPPRPDSAVPITSRYADSPPSPQSSFDKPVPAALDERLSPQPSEAPAANGRPALAPSERVGPAPYSAPKQSEP